MNTIMINGSNPNSGGGYSLYTGLSVVRPVAVNPTNEQYKEITGRECPYPLEYDYVTFERDNQSFQYFPLSFLIENQETGFYDFLRVLVSDRLEQSRSGSFRFMNAVGNSTWAKSTEALASNPKMGWFTSHPHEPLCEGFDTLYNFLKALVVYDGRSDNAAWLKDMQSHGITPERLYKAQDLTGLRELLGWCNKEDHSVGVLYSVKTTVKDGTEKHYQVVETGNTNKNLFVVTARTEPHTLAEWSLKNFKEMVESQKAQSYDVTSREYTIDWTKYSPVANEAPAATSKSEFADALNVV